MKKDSAQRGMEYRNKKRKEAHEQAPTTTRPGVNAGEAMTLGEYRRQEAAGKITRPLTWGGAIGSRPRQSDT